LQKQKVKNDIAHIFFRFEKALSKEHGAFVDFIRALRDAMFVLDQLDLEQCFAVLREKYSLTDEQIQQKLKFEFSWFLRRVKRKVPTPPELEKRYLAVYNLFKDMVCAKSGKKLFATKHGKSAHLSCLKHIRRNCLSDIPFVSYYYPIGEDKDGLPLYKCIRGTSALEGLHQKLRQLVRGFSTSPRFMKALVTIYLGRWNQRLEIEVRGMSTEYDGLYDGNLLDEEIEKMTEWNIDDIPHPDWIPLNAFQSTDEVFGLIDPVNPSMNRTDEEDEAEIQNEADNVANHLLELETGIPDEAVNDLPDSSLWLALSFGRWRPSGRVKGHDEWQYFKDNIGKFQRGTGNISEADNYSEIQWSAYANHWNSMVTELGMDKPSFTYKTASLLQHAHKTLQRRNRRDTTILPHVAGLNNLRDAHTSSANNRQFANQFVVAEQPARAKPINDTLPSSTNFADEDDIETAGYDIESSAELERRVYNGSHRKRRRQQRAPARCRRCGKEYTIEPWRNYHVRVTSRIHSDNTRPQNKSLFHGEGNQVWDYCTVPKSDYEPGYPRLTGRLPRRRRKS
jgi:hypothetical protein